MKKLLKALRNLLAYAWLMGVILFFIGGIAYVITADPREFFLTVSVVLNIGYIGYILYVHDKLFTMRSRIDKQNERINGIEQRLDSSSKKVVDVVKNVIINALERADYKIHSLSIPNDTDIKREIMLVFADRYDFPPNLPEGFILEHGLVPPEEPSGKIMSITLFYKRYRIDMPNWEYDLVLAQDKARLTEWVFSLPDVKSIMQD